MSNDDNKTVDQRFTDAVFRMALQRRSYQDKAWDAEEFIEMIGATADYQAWLRENRDYGSDS